jgi:hypothetical protein
VYLIMLGKVWKGIQALVQDDDRLRDRNWTTIGYICGDNVKYGGFEYPRVSCNQTGEW